MSLLRCVLAALTAWTAVLWAGDSPQALYAYRGATPELDGVLSPGEWADATTFSGVRDWTP